MSSTFRESASPSEPRLQEMLAGLDGLANDFAELQAGIEKAARRAGDDPEAALIHIRKTLQFVIDDVYERRCGEPPGSRPLQHLLERLAKDGQLPPEIPIYANFVKDFGNLGAHRFGGKFTTEQAFHSLGHLMPIIRWYVEAKRSGALDRKPEPPAENGQPKAPPRPTTRLAIVPKGLRSFDSGDAAFFLQLLPGPLDAEGLPESIRFWKHRIESTDETPFMVGVTYGPSGCGKSSLIKAGLSPHLAQRVQSVYVEAAAGDTEQRLLQGLRKRFPNLPADLGLVAAMTALRQGIGLTKKQKVLIVLDQFEQWLHARGESTDTELAQALRQCDGDRVQALLTVRDDFWLPVNRFMAELGIGLLEGQNFALVDLFDASHARSVLEAFGRAYGRLDERLTREQEKFLDRAVEDLAENGRVICVRLALFAQMIKGKPWVAETLQGMGGAQWVGVTFLEETFSDPRADARCRRHQQAARAVLKALSPEQGSDIKGQMRSREELLAASGYQDRPQEFGELLRILDSELRLVTPTHLESATADPATADAGQPAAGKANYYQLTHDYLVPSLRAWLTRKQRETRKGRAELRLAQRSTLWNAKPENQQLPSVWAFLNIQLLTDRKHWTEPERKMMRQAGRVQGIRSGIVAVMLIAIAFAGWEVTGRFQAASLVEQVMEADIAQVPGIVEKFDGYRRWADRLLVEEYNQAKPGPSKLHTALALLPVDAGQVSYLRDQLVVVTPQQFPVVRDALLPHKADVIQPLWLLALDSKRETRQRFQAACALALYTPRDQRWDQVSTLVAGHLVSLQASDFLAWRAALEPAKEQLIGPLTSIYLGKAQREQNRTYATEALADYVADRPDDLFNLLAAAEPFQFPVMYGKLTVHREQAIAFAQAELTKTLPNDASEDDKETLAQRQANAAVALLKLGVAEKVWPALGFHPDVSGDPRARSNIIHWLSPLGCKPQAIIQRWETEPDVTVRRALILALGEFTDAQLPVAQRQPLVQRLLDVFEKEPDAGLHGAAEWLLRKWGQGQRLPAVLKKLGSNEEQLQAHQATEKRRWYVNTQGQTFVIVDADTFEMGSPALQPGHKSDETQHRCHIGRRLAISTTEVTKAQYRTFQRAVNSFDLANHSDLAAVVKTEDSPQTMMTWYEAAWYCNWLSEQEGIPEAQWCYEPAKQEDKKPAGYSSGMKPKEKYLKLLGYRLPTEAEWEFACRAGTVTSRYYGLTEALLPTYAWYLANGEKGAWPVAILKPNDFGLFDMLGNAFEWCDGPFETYPVAAAGKVSEDSGTTQPVVDDGRRVLRGGAFDVLPGLVRSVCRDYGVPSIRYNDGGFRPARTYP